MTYHGAWTTLFEELLRGLVHSLNNRVTAISAYAEMAAGDDESLDGEMLRSEIHRTHAVSTLIGILASRGSEPESLELRPLIDLALEIHRHHPSMRSAGCLLDQGGLVLPVRVPRWALLRLLLLMIDGASERATAAVAAPLEVRLWGDERAVRVTVAGTTVPDADLLGLASLCSGTLTKTGGELTLELPSLLELRRRERSSC